jgi:20S proteasome subunit beta 3
MSNPFSINGGSIVALQGKDCVGIACDLRLGQQALTLSTDFPKIFPMGEKVFLGLSGLATDVQTLYNPPHPFSFRGRCLHLIRLTLA